MSVSNTQLKGDDTMDPTACLQRIMELQAELTQLGEFCSPEQLRNSGHPVYEEWHEAWVNLMEWVLKGGFPPKLESLEPAGKVKQRVGYPGETQYSLPKYEWIERDHLYSDRAGSGFHASIYREDNGNHMLHIYAPSGKCLKSVELEQ